MTGIEYEKALGQLGLTKAEAGEFLGLTDRTSRTYAVKGPTKVVTMLLRVMIEKQISVEEINKIMKRKVAS